MLTITVSVHDVGRASPSLNVTVPTLWACVFSAEKQPTDVQRTAIGAFALGLPGGSGGWTALASLSLSGPVAEMVQHAPQTRGIVVHASSQLRGDGWAGRTYPKSAVISAAQHPLSWP